MGAFLFYLLKSGCCLVIFYIFFKLMMSRSTFSVSIVLLC